MFPVSKFHLVAMYIDPQKDEHYFKKSNAMFEGCVSVAPQLLWRGRRFKDFLPWGPFESDRFHQYNVRK